MSNIPKNIRGEIIKTARTTVAENNGHRDVHALPECGELPHLISTLTRPTPPSS